MPMAAGAILAESRRRAYIFRHVVAYIPGAFPAQPACRIRSARSADVGGKAASRA